MFLSFTKLVDINVFITLGFPHTSIWNHDTTENTVQISVQIQLTHSPYHKNIIFWHNLHNLIISSQNPQDLTKRIIGDSI